MRKRCACGLQEEEEEDTSVRDLEGEKKREIFLSVLGFQFLSRSTFISSHGTEACGNLVFTRIELKSFQLFSELCNYDAFICNCN